MATSVDHIVIQRLVDGVVSFKKAGRFLFLKPLVRYAVFQIVLMHFVSHAIREYDKVRIETIRIP